MRRQSIARSVRLALLGLSLILSALAGLGIADLYGARQRYEDRIGTAFALEADAANLLAASVVEEATLRTAHGPHRELALARARAAFSSAADQAARDAVGDPPSRRLVAAAVSAQADLRAPRLTGGVVRVVRADILSLAARQAHLRADARTRAGEDSRTALIAILAAGGLALVVVLGLVSLLLARVREPLDDLVGAAGRLAAGDLAARVPAAGPAELRALAEAFNAMADDLAGALARLEDERRRLEVTIASLSDGLLVIDADGVVLTANPRAAALLPELAPGTAVASTAPGETTLERHGRTLAVAAATLDTGAGERPSVVWTVRDVSERAQLERLKSEFVATASHELRSPLTSIKGFVELLAQTDDLSPKQRDFVEIIRTSTERLVHLVGDLLDIARVEAGEIEISRQPTAVLPILADVVRLIGPRVGDKDQTIELAGEEELPSVLVDPARFHQIITNLITNAHLYTPPGGAITVTARRHERRVEIGVADTGRGLSPTDLEHVFDRFYRSPGSTAQPGSGLGLAIVRSLVDLNHGEIDVASTQGEGTTFTVSFEIA